MKQPHYWEKAKKHLSKNDKVMKTLIDQYEGETLASHDNGFYTLARAIVGQQISVKAADSVWANLENALNKNICPKNFKKLPASKFENIGLSKQKILYLNNIADFFNHQMKGQLALHKYNHQEISERLIEIKGVGKWTVEMFMIFHMQASDELPLGDIGLLKAIHNNYKHKSKTLLNAKKIDLKDKKHKAEIEKISDVWKPYRTAATWYLWRSIDPVPVAY
jgi:DNA-3-methyladenine glycosylase II